MEKQSDLYLEKLKIANKLDEVMVELARLRLKIYGDEENDIPGFDGRLKKLEKIELSRIDVKKEALKMIVGSITIAIGGAIVWIFVSLKAAFVAKGN